MIKRRGKKGSNKITSILYDFVMNQLARQVQNVEFLCVSYGGQNKKKYTVFRFFYKKNKVSYIKDAILTLSRKGHAIIN